jgi:hypothetical protein
MATSKLQRKFGDMLDSDFPQFRIRENYRPDWLISSDGTHLELDFFVEEIKMAFEVQGGQHFEYIPFFHKDEADFKKRRRHDAEKRTLCYGQRVKLIEICTETDALIAIKNIQERHCKSPKYFYHKDPVKPTKRELINSDKVKRERFESCRRKLRLYEKGQLQATEEKVAFWKQVIRDGGFAKGWFDTPD